ncbi:UBX domain-containing protein 11 isoform X2 [Rattus norvegicus]|uniref:UBX domain-containing protein 11 isoform X2 n=2 Tax=Rattus norvegicus TaxID=10116 RepID=UPI0003D0AFAE|eukprot:XP_006239064.1 PREDICTED: UBX domain-containing protein 11 isoform X4 [Rattus norvegicus]
MRSARVLVAWETPRQQDGGAAGRLAGPVESLTVNPNTGAMSSPLASLSKTRKVPLESEPVNPGRRGIRIYGDEDEVDMVNDGQDSEEKISLPSCYGGIGRQGLMIHDSELLTSMARKLQELEQQLKARNEEMLSKRFLNDYGLQWVGEPMDQENSEGKIISESDERDWMKAKKFWKPGDSIVPPEVDFDRLLSSLQDLSELVVEGEAQVTPVPGGAQFRTLEPIPLKLYRNGIMMFDGPFRPFYDPYTQRCLRDILDGFFPSELQRLYPDGVPFKVSDLRNQVYPEDGLGPFPGEGRVVGRQKIRKVTDRVEETSGSRMTAEKFLNRLPKCVIRQGEVIDIRGPIRDTLQNCCPMPVRIQEIIVETPALASERQRTQESPNMPVPPLSMLRIKSENGEQAFLLMMRPEDTIGDVRNLLAQARDMDSAAFEILSTFPPTVYRDDTVTLQAAGLVPNATLLLRTRRVLPANPSFGTDSGPGSLP